MAIKLQTLAVPLKLNSTSYGQGLQQAAAKTKGFGASVGGITAGASAAFAAMAVVAIAALVAMAAAYISFISKAISAGSDLEQSIGGVEAIFGKASATIFNFGQTAAESVGLSKSAFFEMATPTAALLQNLGFSLQESADEVVNLTKRAADMAATFGGTTKDALAAINSALRGSAQMLEKYGAGMTAIQIKTRAAELGLIGLDGVLTESAKTTARLSLLYDQTAKTQGQFARESNTLAGQMERVKATMANFSETIGTLLLPVVVPLVDKFMELAKVVLPLMVRYVENITIPVLTWLAEAIGKVFSALITLVKWLDANVFGNILQETLELAEEMDDLGDIVLRTSAKFTFIRSTVNSTALALQNATSASLSLRQVSLSLRAAEERLASIIRGTTVSMVSRAQAALSLERAQRKLLTVGRISIALNLSHQQSVLSLRRAQLALRELTEDSATSDIDREQALLDVDVAQRRVNETIWDRTASELERRQAVIDLERAEERLTDTTEGSERADIAYEEAVLAVEQAQLSLLDSTTALKNADLDRRDVILSVQSAQEAYNNTLRGGTTSGLAYEQALFDVELATIAMEEATKDLNEALAVQPDLFRASMLAVHAFKDALAEVENAGGLTNGVDSLFDTSDFGFATGEIHQLPDFSFQNETSSIQEDIGFVRSIDYDRLANTLAHAVQIGGV